MATGTIPLDLLQAFLPLCVFYPVTDNGAILSDVVLKPLKEKADNALTKSHKTTKSSMFLLNNGFITAITSVFIQSQGWAACHQWRKREVSTYLPLPKFVIVQLLFISDLLFWWWWQKFELPLFGLPQQLLSSDLNLCGSFVLHLKQKKKSWLYS